MTELITFLLASLILGLAISEVQLRINRWNWKYDNPDLWVRDGRFGFRPNQRRRDVG